MAWSAITENRLRSGITVSIIALGITALVGILTALDGLAGSLQESFTQLGSNSFSITDQQGSRQRGRGRSARDFPPISRYQAEAFMRRYEGAGRVSISFTATGQATVAYRNLSSNPNVEVKGIEGAYLATAGLDLWQGRDFSSTEVETGRPVAIIGAELQQNLFGATSAVGQWVRVNGQQYRVIGVLAPKGSAIGRSSDRTVLLPLTTARQSFAASQAQYAISVRVPSIRLMDPAVIEAGGVMRLVRGLAPGEKDNFVINRSDNLTSTLAENLGYVRSVALVVGFITLLGAAIGLMNIMLVSVTERTTEIGVRKALGAPSAAVRAQFLVESLLVSQAGGVAGFLLGLTMGNLVSVAVEGPFVIPWGWLLGSILLCLVVGVAAGLYPAARAARLDPIESLRYE